MMRRMWVPDSKRNQGEAGFVCSHCGKRIREREYYYCHVITKEKYVKKDGVVEVVPKKAFQIATWCKKCYEEILKM
ncbi:MAG: hypothetical protein J7J87_04760 [Candidatus Diapherotrites archaeon]|nr:hypothetical protein [Candidatus Diapherotrites archaeon]